MWRTWLVEQISRKWLFHGSQDFQVQILRRVQFWNSLYNDQIPLIKAFLFQQARFYLTWYPQIIPIKYLVDLPKRFLLQIDTGDKKGSVEKGIGSRDGNSTATAISRLTSCSSLNASRDRRAGFSSSWWRGACLLVLLPPSPSLPLASWVFSRETSTLRT